jgi:xylulokinase
MIAQTYLGLDLGTSELKGLLMASDGNVIETAGASIKSAYTHPGWSEQNPQDWWQACVQVCQALRDKAPQEFSRMRSVGLSGHMHGATLLDSEGQVLRPCIMWNDTRSQVECVELSTILPTLEEITGNLAMPGFTAPKVLWVKNHEPAVFAKIAKVLLPKDYLRFLLTGKYVGEMSDAAGTLWLDVKKRAWSDTALMATGLNRSHMPDLVEGSEVSAYVSKQAAAVLGLPEAIAVAGGAGDNAASAIGIGAISNADAFISLGTSGVIFSVTDQHCPNTKDAVHAFCHALPNTWHQMAVMLSAASCLRWVKDLTGEENEAKLIESVSRLSHQQLNSAPIFLPYLSGERTPHNDANASGSFLGLRTAHGKAELTYSVIEGVGFGLREGLVAMQNAGAKINSAQLVGGGSRSSYWNQLLSNILGIELCVGESASVGAALGAARLAWMCTQEQTMRSWSKICSKPSSLAVYYPQTDKTDSLSIRYEIFRNAYRANKAWFESSQKKLQALVQAN